jgi:hypothetical protein
MTGSMIGGRAEAGAIVWTPEPVIANAIVSKPGLAFASRIAWRRLPAPESAVVVTVKVAAVSGAATRAVPTRTSPQTGRAAARRTSQTVRNVEVAIPHYIARPAELVSDGDHIRLMAPSRRR